MWLTELFARRLNAKVQGGSDKDGIDEDEMRNWISVVVIGDELIAVKWTWHNSPHSIDVFTVDGCDLSHLLARAHSPPERYERLRLLPFVHQWRCLYTIIYDRH